MKLIAIALKNGIISQEQAFKIIKTGIDRRIYSLQHFMQLFLGKITLLYDENGIAQDHILTQGCYEQFSPNLCEKIVDLLGKKYCTEHLTEYLYYARQEKYPFLLNTRLNLAKRRIIDWNLMMNNLALYHWLLNGCAKNAPWFFKLIKEIGIPRDFATECEDLISNKTYKHEYTRTAALKTIKKYVF